MGVSALSGMLRSAAGGIMLSGSAVLVAGTTAMSGYLGALTIAAIAPRRPHRSDIGSTRLTILVPAHNESAVIGRAIDGWRSLDYPDELFSVHVVADNCTDDTAAIVRAAGFQVHERTDPDNPGKGAALNWLFDRLDGEPDPPDAYAIVDADTTLDRGFLTAMAAALSDGVPAAQGYYSVLEPDASVATNLRYAALACRHHTRALGRTRLGASCGLYGNGMVFTREVLQGRRWTGHLVEDAEFQMELLLDDIVVTYVPEARLEAEMPTSLAASESQNQRWESGRLQLARQYMPRLARRALRSRGRRRLAAIDATLDHAVPPLSILVVAEAAALAATSLLRVVRPATPARALSRLSVLSFIALIGHVVVSLVAVRAPRHVYWALLSAPHVALWKARLWVTALRSGDETEWIRTERNEPSILDDSCSHLDGPKVQV